MADIARNTSYDPKAMAGAMVGLSSAASKLGKGRRNMVQESTELSSLAGKVQSFAQAQPSPAPTATPSSSSSGSRTLPQSLASLGAITTPYGGKTRYESFHPGLDIGAPIGKPIPFVSGGKVVETSKGHVQGEKGYGNYVVVQDDRGNKVKYSHLNDFDVTPGQTVSPGQVDMTIGNSGSTYSTSGGTGAHLDIRIRDMFNTYLDPYEYFRALDEANRGRVA